MENLKKIRNWYVECNTYEIDLQGVKNPSEEDFQKMFNALKNNKEKTYFTDLNKIMSDYLLNNKI